MSVIDTPSASASSVYLKYNCMESVKFNFSRYFGVAVLGLFTLKKLAICIIKCPNAPNLERNRDCITDRIEPLDIT